MLIPYIGITDFTDYSQVQAMLQVFEQHRKPCSARRLHVGVMMSYKTLYGIPTKWMDFWAPKETLPKIFQPGDAYNCLHFADYENNPGLSRSLSYAIWLSGPDIHGLQLDMIWPDPTKIAQAVRARRKPVEVILQIGENALQAVGNDPRVLVEKLHYYVDDAIIQRVLLDKSMGGGLGMSASELLPFARAIREHFPTLGLVFAGGLGPKDEDIGLVKPLIEEFPDASIDAQNKLKPHRDPFEPTDWHMAEAYLIKALELLK